MVVQPGWALSSGSLPRIDLRSPEMATVKISHESEYEGLSNCYQRLRAVIMSNGLMS
jgi:effector-binding domain-containing protein